MSPARTHVVATGALAAVIAAGLALRAAHLPRTLTALMLGLLAAAGFAGVVGFHMNLRTEPRWLRSCFAASFVLPVLYVVALVADAWMRGLRP
jgi:uncharacterized membrane protein